VINPEIRPPQLEGRSAWTTGSSRTDRDASGPRVILLFTRDRAIDEAVAAALLGSSAIILIARTVSDAIQIVCGRGRELDLAIFDVDEECRGMTLLSAVHTCYGELPVLITTARDEEQFRTLAYANGARACLRKPFATVALADAIAALSSSREGSSARGPREPSARSDSLGGSSFASNSHIYDTTHQQGLRA
jgi:DNA-binding response OmpR family regulator